MGEEAMDLLHLLSNDLPLLLVIIVRLTGIFLVAPVFSAQNIPAQAKVGLATLIGFVAFPMLQKNQPQIPSDLLTFTGLIAVELVIGFAIGYVASLVFAAVQLGGQLIDMQIGFGVVNVVDPQTGTQLPLVGNFQYLLALVLFLGTGGHRILLSTMIQSFQLIPLGGAIPQPELGTMMIDLTGNILSLGLQLSIPIIGMVFLTDLALGIMSRTIPQMNVFVLGLPLKIILGTFLLALLMPVFGAVLESLFERLNEDVIQTMHLLIPGG